jgi:benzoyl-CoA 2,3-dioxygenase component B
LRSARIVHRPQAFLQRLHLAAFSSALQHVLFTAGRSEQPCLQPSHQTGEYASWIAPPRIGINQKPGDFEYVKLYSDL